MKLLVALLALAAVAPAQIQIDPQIAGEISKIKAIDNHAHPVLPTAGDAGYDALPVEHMDPYTEPVRTRAGSPLGAEASHATVIPTGCWISWGSFPSKMR